MRIYVDLPQAYLARLHPGIKATLQLPGMQEPFDAELVSMSNALTQASRTGLVELQAENPDNKLWPGAFAEVHFHIPSGSNTLSVPATALIFGAHGMQAAVVGEDNKVELKPVVLGRNLGNTIEVQSGLTLADRPINSPLESTRNGDSVHVAASDARPAKTVKVA